MRWREEFPKQLKKALLGLLALLPMLLAVIGLVGVLRVFISREMLASFFQGNPVADTLAGTVAGMVAMGQPILSYIMGGELLEQGVSLYAVAAFILAWVTLGIVQLPLEAEVLGLRFTILRNVLAFVFTIAVAVVTVWSLQWLR